MKKPAEIDLGDTKLSADEIQSTLQKLFPNQPVNIEIDGNTVYFLDFNELEDFCLSAYEIDENHEYVFKSYPEKGTETRLIPTKIGGLWYVLRLEKSTGRANARITFAASVYQTAEQADDLSLRGLAEALTKIEAHGIYKELARRALGCIPQRYRAFPEFLRAVLEVLRDDDLAVEPVDIRELLEDWSDQF